MGESEFFDTVNTRSPFQKERAFCPVTNQPKSPRMDQAFEKKFRYLNMTASGAGKLTPSKQNCN